MGTIADKIAYLATTKDLIRQAIETKGVGVGTDISFREYYEKILQISGGGGGGGTAYNLPFSDQNSIICEAETTNFNRSASTWGKGNTPIQYLNGTPSFNIEENAVLFPTKTAGIIGYLDLGAPNTPYTVYMVAKMLNPANYNRALCCMYERSSGRGMTVINYQGTVRISQWGDNFEESNISSSSEFFVTAVRFTNANDAKGWVNGFSLKKSPSASGQYISIGRTDINPSTTNAEPCDIYVRYLALIDSAEDDTIIQGNVTALYWKYVEGKEIPSGGGTNQYKLPYSKQSKIICEADITNFKATASTWGKGSSPVQYIGGVPTLDTAEKAISFLTKTNGNIGYVDLGAPNTPYTAYVVMRMVNPTGDQRALGCMYSRTTGNGMLILKDYYSNNLRIDSWNSGQAIGVSCEGYFVGCIKYGVDPAGYVNGLSLHRSPGASGQYVTLLRPDIDPNTTWAEPSDGMVKFIGVVNEEEDELTIQGNIVALYYRYILEEDIPGSGGGGESMFHEYSTEEKVVGTWINGKPIYEITIQNSNKSTDIDVTSLNIETVIYLDALGADDGSTIIDGSPSSGHRWTICGVTTQSREIYLRSDGHIIRPGYFATGAVLIQYTKTTDPIPNS